MSAQTSCLVLFFLALSVLPAAAAPAAPKALQPDQSGSVVAQVVARILEHAQYERKPLDAATSRDMLELYVKDFDPDRMF
ncbi:MAG TPA: hypothetical protein VH309_00365, partial [Elusimicrobiota bacterium]|nr:hypothetical protein [Elusimicrobiota bacterium]